MVYCNTDLIWWFFKGCLYEKQGGANHGRDDFSPVFICRLIQSERDSKIGLNDLILAFFSNELLTWLHNFTLLVDIVDKTTLPESKFKFNSSFSVLLINFIYEIKNMNVFEYLRRNVRKHLWKKQSSRTCLPICLS